MTTRKRPVTGGMRVKAYEVVHTAVEDGVSYGWNQAHKRTAKPDAELVKAAIVAGVVLEICNWFDFDEEGT